jgi:transposase
VAEKELARGAARRLAILRHAREVTGNVSATCRYFGITRQAFYIWLRRYEELGLEGLRDQSRRPHVSPNETKADVVGKIVYLRQHHHFGPHKISMYLKRYHDVQVSASGIWRILKRLDMSRLPASQRYRRHTNRWKRYEKPLPGHRVQVDVEFIAPLKGSRKKHHQFTAIDDCTRIRVLRIYDRLNQQGAIRFLDYVLEKLPFKVEVIQTDNGAEFGSQFQSTSWTGGSATSTSSRPRRGSMARSNGPTGSTRRSSIGCSKGSLSTTPASSTTASRSGRTSTTSTARMGASAVRRRMRGSGRRLGARCERAPSAAQSVVG